MERLRSSAYEAFRLGCMRSIEVDLASVRTFLRVPVMNICRRQERNAAMAMFVVVPGEER